MTLGDHAFERPVGRRDDARVDGDLFVATDAMKSLFLENAEKFGLEREIEVADFVEKERRIVRLLEFPDPRRGRSGERAFFVAEELRLEEVFRNGGAVHGDEGTVGTMAVLVEGPGDQFLPRPGLAADQHGHGRRGKTTEGFVDIEHGPAVPDEGVALLGEFIARVDRDGLGALARTFDGLAHDAADFTRIERFGEEIEGSGLDRLDRRAAPRCPRDPDHGEERSAAVEGFEPIKTSKRLA